VRDHALIEELTAARALGGLDPEEAATLQAEMASHGPDCAECRRLEADADEVAGRLAFAVDPVALPEGFEDRVLATATREASGTAEAAPRVLPRRKPTGPAWLWPLVAAAALALFVGGWAAGDLFENDAVVAEGARVVTFDGQVPGNLFVAYAPGTTGVYVLGSDLETPPAGRVYELWMISDGTPVAGSCFRPAADGSVFRFLDADVRTTDTMAVTLEPSECSTRPTSDPILTAPIERA
jgi:Anti-sigma-K factor rskA